MKARRCNICGGLVRYDGTPPSISTPPHWHDGKPVKPPHEQIDDWITDRLAANAQPRIQIDYNTGQGWIVSLRHCPPPLRGWIGSDGNGSTLEKAIYNAFSAKQPTKPEERDE